MRRRIDPTITWAPSRRGNEPHPGRVVPYFTVDARGLVAWGEARVKPDNGHRFLFIRDFLYSLDLYNNRVWLGQRLLEPDDVLRDEYGVLRLEMMGASL